MPGASTFNNQPVIHALDFALINAIPAVRRVEAQISTSIQRHQSLQERHGRNLPTVNLAELVLVASRGSRRLPPWLLRSQNSQTGVAIEALLEIRAQFSKKICESKVVPRTKVGLLATYLSVSACPSVSSLVEFASIQPNRARLWLRRLSGAGLVLLLSTPNELICLNHELVARLAGETPDEIAEQFQQLRRKPRWLRDSSYRTVS